MPLAVAILLGDPRISGGTNVILEHALGLQRAAHRVTLLTKHRLAADALAWKPAAATLPRATLAAAASTEFDLALATWWGSTYHLPLLRAKRCAAFVQSIESRFFAGEHPWQQALAAATYRVPLPVVTEANWIARELRDLRGRTVDLVRNGIDKTAFTTIGDRLADAPSHGLRALVEGPLGVGYKRTELALRSCQRAGFGGGGKHGELWLLTATPNAAFAGVDRVCRGVAPSAVGAVYRSCDVLVKLSTIEGMFGPPLEAMHCGCVPITTDVTGHDEFMRDRHNGLVVPIGEELAVIDALRDLSADRRALQALRAGALQTAASWPDWAAATREFVAFVERAAADRRAPASRELAAPLDTARRAARRAHGLRPVELVQRHLRAFMRRRLPRFAGRERGERAPRASHPTTYLPNQLVPRLLASEATTGLFGFTAPLDAHVPFARTPGTMPLHLALCVGRWPDDLQAAVRLRLCWPDLDAFDPSGTADAHLVVDLDDGLALRARGHVVAGTWLPPVRDDFLAIAADASAWRTRPHARLDLVEGVPRGAHALPLTADAETLRAAFARTRVVCLPARPRAARLAAARAVLAMAAGCLVVSPPLALAYQALPDEHFLATTTRRRAARAEQHPDAECIRQRGRALAQRHGAELRFTRLLAQLRAREPAAPNALATDR